MYRVFRYLSPPIHRTTGHWYTPKLYIFMILYQFQINLQIFRALALLTYFRSHGFCVKVEQIFVNFFCILFGGSFRKMSTKSSVIGLDICMIPHFKANNPCHMPVSLLHYFDNHVYCGIRFNGSKLKKRQSNFVKNRFDTLAPPYPAKLRNSRQKTVTV